MMFRDPITVWLPIIGSGTEDDRYRPAGIVEPMMSASTIPDVLDRESELRGHPAVDWVEVEIERSDWLALDAELKRIGISPRMREDVPEEDAALCDLVKLRATGGLSMTEREEAKVEEYLASIASMASDKEMFARLIAHMVERGLSPEAGMRLGEKYDCAYTEICYKRRGDA